MSKEIIIEGWVPITLELEESGLLYAANVGGFVAGAKLSKESAMDVLQTNSETEIRVDVRKVGYKDGKIIDITDDEPPQLSEE